MGKLKKIGEYTTRGQLEDQTTKKIQLFDGRFDTGFKVVEFIVASNTLTVGRESYGTLSTEYFTNDLWDWSDNIQIAWAASQFVNDGGQGPFTLVDPDNLVVEDLYIRGLESGDGTLNYFIRLEKYDITDWQGALSMVRNKSQA